VSGQPLVVLDSDRSQHERRQVHVDDAVAAELVVDVSAITVAQHARRTILLLAPSLDTVNTSTTPNKLECGPMPNVMAALPNIGGTLCSTPQSLADAHY